MVSKKITYTFILIVLFSQSYSQQYHWIQRTPLPAVSRFAPTGFSIAGLGYIALGLDTIGNYHNDLWQFDPSTDSWSQKANFPGTSRFAAVAFVIGSYAYLGTGWDPAGCSDFYRYDPLLNSWSPIANYGGIPSYTNIALSINGKAYVGIGFSPNTNEFWEYDPVADNWTAKSNFPGTLRQSCAAFSINGYGYVGTGGYGNFPQYSFNDFWKYDATIDVWTQIADYAGVGRWGTACFTLGGKGFVGMGTNGTINLLDFYSYDPVANIWTQIDSFPTVSRAEPAFFSIAQSGFLCGGGNLGGLSSFNELWEYGPATTLNIQSAFSSITCHGANDGIASAIITNGVPPYTFLWSPGGQTTSTINNLIPGIYSCTITDSIGQMDSISVTITQPSEIFSNINGTADVCNGEQAQLVGTAIGGSLPYTFTWDGGAYTGQLYTFVPGASGVHYVIAADGNGCYSDTSYFYVSVHSLAAPQIIQMNDTLFVHANSTYTSYQWYYNGVLMPGATDTILLTIITGVYNMFVTDAFGCEANSFLKVDDLAISSQNNTATVMNWDFQKQLAILHFNRNIRNIHYSIFNYAGQLLKSELALNNCSNISVDFSAYSSGLYLLIIFQDDKIIFQTMIVR